MFYINRPDYLSVRLCILLSINQSICLSICVFRSAYLSLCLSACLSSYASIEYRAVWSELPCFGGHSEVAAIPSGYDLGLGFLFSGWHKQEIPAACLWELTLFDTVTPRGTT